jgi:hypothetical protein
MRSAPGFIGRTVSYNGKEARFELWPFAFGAGRKAELHAGYIDITRSTHDTHKGHWAVLLVDPWIPMREDTLNTRLFQNYGSVKGLAAAESLAENLLATGVVEEFVRW